MSVTLGLPPCCTLVQAEAIALECRAAFRSDAQGLRIDASALEEADVSLIQILVAAQKSCKGAGRDFALVLSPPLKALAARAGFSVSAGGLTPVAG